MPETDTIQTGYPLRIARAAAIKIVRALAPVCTRLRVCGSCRREEDWCNDLDLVVSPKQAPGLFGTPSGEWSCDFLNLLCRGGASANQPRLWNLRGPALSTSKRLTLHSIRNPDFKVELWPVLPESFGWMCLIRTGPRQVGTGLMRCAAARGFEPHVQHCLRHTRSGPEVIPMRDEHEACKALGVEWQPRLTEARLELARDLHAIADAAGISYDDENTNTSETA